MTTLTARFKQTPTEVRRYVLDYTLQLSPGETISTIVTSVSSPTGGNLNLVVSNIAIATGALQAAFFAGGGQNLQSYEIDFVTTTSLGQTFEDVVQIDIASKV